MSTTDDRLDIKKENAISQLGLRTKNSWHYIDHFEWLYTVQDIHTIIDSHRNREGDISKFALTVGAMASQITSLTIVYSTVYSGADQRKHQSSASLAFVRGIHRWPVNSPYKWPVTRKLFPFNDVIMFMCYMLLAGQKDRTSSKMLIEAHYNYLCVDFTATHESLSHHNPQYTSALCDPTIFKLSFRTFTNGVMNGIKFYFSCECNFSLIISLSYAPKPVGWMMFFPRTTLVLVHILNLSSNTDDLSPGQYTQFIIK